MPLLGVVLLIVGVFLSLWTTADTRLTTAGGILQAAAYLVFVAAGVLRPRKWLFALLLAPFSYWFWLLSLGH